MTCKNCGAELTGTKFCTECGAPVQEAEQTLNEQNNAVEAAEEATAEQLAAEAEKAPVDEEVRRARANMAKFEQGTIELDGKTEKKRKFYCPKNPMLASFLAVLACGLVFLIVTAIMWASSEVTFFSVIANIGLTLFSAAIIVLGVVGFLIPAFKLDRLFKGKGVVMEYRLKESELEEQAQKSKKQNRWFYIVCAVISLLFVSVISGSMVNSEVKTPIMWFALWCGIVIFAGFVTLLFVMPKVNYETVKANGERVIIGERSVYFGGRYYYWGSKVEPKLTYGNYNPKKEILDLTYTSVKKNGASKKHRLEIYVPERELKGVTKMLDVFQLNIKEYRLQEEKNKIVSADSADVQKNKKK